MANTTTDMMTITKKDGTTVSVPWTNLSAENATKLYEALGQTGTQMNYQQLADQVAGFTRNFKSIVTVGLPMGMDWQQAMTNFMRALKEGGGKINDEKDKYLKELEASPLGQSIIQSGIYQTAAGTAAAIGAVASFGRGMARPIQAVGAVWDATTGTAGDMYDQIGFGMSEAQAKAVGAAYAAALYSKVDAPSVRHEATMIDKAIAGVQAGASSVWHWLPPEVTAFFTAIGKWFSNGYNWGKAYDEALAEEKVSRATPSLTYAQTLERNIANNADKASRPEAAEMLRNAQTIAGIGTAPVADMIKNGGVYRDTSGTFQTLQFDKGAPVTAALKDEQGQPLTLANRTRTRLQAVADAVLPHNTPDFLGEAAVTAAVVGIEKRFSPLRATWNGLMHFGGGMLKLPVNLALGGLAGLSQGAAKVAGWVLPSSAGSEANVVAKAADKAGNEAAAAAAKLGKKQGLTGDALEAMVQEARQAARAKILDSLVDPRGVVAKAADVARPVGDLASKMGSAVNNGLEITSKVFSNAIDSVKSFWSFDRTTDAEKAALAAKFEAEAALGKVSQATLDAARAQKAATFTGRVSGLFSDIGSHIGSHISWPTWLGGKTRVAEEVSLIARDVASEVGSKVGYAFKGARWVGKAVPLVGVVVVGGEMVFASGAHADTVDGVTLGYREQLVKDYIVGRITRTQYKVYQHLQDYYPATGLGGLITAGVLEVGQDAASELDKANVARYLPATIVDSIRTLSGDKMPEVAPQQASQLLTAAERLARIHEIQKENEINMSQIDSRLAMRIALGGAAPDSSILNSTINWERVLQSVATVPPAPDKPVTSVNTPTPLTQEQLLAGHEEVIAQARMAVNRGSAPAKLEGFNLGTGFAAVHSTGAGAVALAPSTPDSSNAQQSAGLFALGA